MISTVGVLMHGELICVKPRSKDVDRRGEDAADFGCLRAGSEMTSCRVCSVEFGDNFGERVLAKTTAFGSGRGRRGIRGFRYVIACAVTVTCWPAETRTTGGRATTGDTDPRIQRRLEPAAAEVTRRGLDYVTTGRGFAVDINAVPTALTWVSRS